MAGRPVEWSEEIEAMAWDYVENFAGFDDKVPMVVGLARAIEVGRSTIYDWAERQVGQFPDILRAISEHQERELINKGLAGEFNSPIAKMLLAKHGYSDKVDSSVDSTLNIKIVEFKDDED